MVASASVSHSTNFFTVMLEKFFQPLAAFADGLNLHIKNLMSIFEEVLISVENGSTPVNVTIRTF